MFPRGTPYHHSTHVTNRAQALQRTIYFVLLSPHSNEQSDLLARIHADSRNETHCPEDAKLLRLFTVPEIMRWPIVAEQYGPHLTSSDIFSTSLDTDAAAKPSGQDDKAHQRWNDLRKRVIEHNVRTIAKYYTRVRTARLTELLDLPESETESYISELVTSGTIYARIDRPAGVVSFVRKRDADDVLNEWSSDVRGLLGLLERIDHLIMKEEMMARIQPGEAKKAGKAVRAH